MEKEMEKQERHYYIVKMKTGTLLPLIRIESIEDFMKMFDISNEEDMFEITEEQYIDFKLMTDYFLKKGN